MGIWDTLKQQAGETIKTHGAAQFLDVIEWLDDTRDTLVYRFPIFNQAITNNSKLIVREGQNAVFVSEGQLSACFGPGSYDLATKNTPIASFFESIKYGLNYPYKGEVYFINIRKFTDQKWGTPQPMPVRDPQFGSIQIRAFGTYTFKISDPTTFIKEVVGTDGLVTTEEISSQLKKKVLSVFASLLSGAQIGFDMLVGAGMALADALKEKLSPIFQEDYGITVTDFTVDGVTLPPKVQEYYEKRQGMAFIGDLDAYTRLQAADAIGVAAANPGLGGAGIGMGVGFGMGNQMGGMMSQAMQSGGTFNPHQGQPGASAAPPPPPPMGGTKYHYNGVGGQGQFTPQEIGQLVAANRQGVHNVWSPGWAAWKSWNEVPELVAAVPALPPPLPGGDLKFHYHGPDAQTREITVAEIANLVKAAPTATHSVWKAGFDAWKPAKDVPEIAAFLSAGPPPPPPGSAPPPPPAF